MTMSQQGQMDEATFFHKRAFFNFMNDRTRNIECIGLLLIIFTKPVSLQPAMSILKTAYNTHFLKRIILFFVPISIGAKIILERIIPIKDMENSKNYYQNVIFHLQIKHICLMIRGMLVAIILSGFT